ncbi:MAG: PAS domain S-box protein [Desulfomonile tiedjei]|nr:PAS domain S-box protein [Desulfomonile tiedjei]
MTDERRNTAAPRILIWADDTQLGEEMARTLRNLGHEVTGVVSKGEEAVRATEEFKPDLLLMDIEIEGRIDGVEAAERICNRFDIPVVYLTGYTEEDLLDRVKTTQPYGYVAKTATLLELKSKVDTALLKHAADKRVRESEQRYRTLVEDSFDGIFVQKGTEIVFANSLLHEMLGYEPGELIGKDHWIIYHPEHQPMVRERAQARLRGESVIDHYEVKLQSKEGKSLEGEIRAKAVLFEGESGVQVWVRDVTDQKRAQEEIRLLGEAIEQSHEGIAVVDLDGNITFLNSAFADMHGYSPDELKGSHLSVFHTEDQMPQVAAANRLVRETGQFKGEVWHVRRDGTPFPTLMHNSLLRDRQGKPVGMIGTMRDISDLKKAEDLLQIEKQQFQKLVENAPFGLVIIDKDGGFRYANPNFLETFGYSLEEVPNGRQWFRKAFPEPRLRREAISAWVEDCREAPPGEQRPHIFTVKCKDGTDKVIHFRPAQLLAGHHLMTCEDITERWHAEEQLRESEEEFRRIIDNLQDVFYRATMDGTLIFLSPALERVLGFKPEEWVGLNVAELYVNPSDRIDFVELIVENGFVNDFQTRLKHKNGGVVWISTSARLFKNRDGTTAGVEGIVRDISDRKRMEIALSESQQIFRLLSEQSLMSVAILQDGVYHYANEAMASLLEYSVDEILGWRPEQFLDLAHPDDRSLVLRQARMKQAGDADQVPHYSFRIITKSGITKWVDIFSKTVQFQGRPANLITMLDITERRRAEEALQESEERFRNAFHTSPDAVNINRLDDGLCVDINMGFTELTGYTREDVIGKSSLEINIWDDPADRERLFAGLKEDGQVRNLEAQFRLKDGRVRTGLMSARIIVLGGEPHILSVTRDVEDWKEAEEALRKSEATLRSLLQAAPVGIGQVSANRTLGWTNQLLCTMLGYSREELAGQSARILYETEEEFLRVGREKHPDVIRHGTGSVETRFQRKDGSAFDVLLSSSAVVPGDLSHGMVFTAMDISERKRAEKQIRLNEARLQSLYDISQHPAESIQGVLDFTLNEAVKLTESEVGYIYFYDEEKNLLELNSWSKQVMKECEVAEPQTVYEVEKTGMWGEAVKQRKPIVVNDFQAPNPLKKGYPSGHVELHNFMTIPVFWRDRIVAVIGVANKATDYDESDVRQLALLMDSVWKIAEARHSELAQRRSATALEYAAEGVVITDTDGTIQYVNPSLGRMTGYAREELLGNNPRVLKSGVQDKAFYEHLWQTIKSGDVWTGRFVNKRKDGTLYTEEATISPVRDASGAITNFVGMKRDITDQLALSKQLFHAQKMEAVGTLAGGIAHDFNNLLQAILGYSDILLMKKLPGDPDRKKLEVIQHAARDGADLVGRILTFSRKSESKIRPIDLNDEIRRVGKLLLRTLPRMIQIDLLLADDLRIVDADPAQIEQVMLNLGVNAQHAMPAGGRLLIETSNVSLSDEYLRTHLDAKKGKYVLLSVSDTGVGIEPDVLDRIFEPFFTTKTSAGGTGLGLSMVHGIVSQHGGYIRCYSEPGRGTSFKIYLPVSATELIPDLTLTREMPAFGTETILLVDDDDRIREMGRHMIEMGGYQVITACSGEEALEKYTVHREEIALIILDLIMPGMGGHRCLEELLRVDPDVSVLVASGYSSNGLTRDQKGRGAKGFVSKPYDAKDILGTIRRVLDSGHL